MTSAKDFAEQPPADDQQLQQEPDAITLAWLRHRAKHPKRGRPNASDLPETNRLSDQMADGWEDSAEEERLADQRKMLHGGE